MRRIRHKLLLSFMIIFLLMISVGVTLYVELEFRTDDALQMKNKTLITAIQADQMKLSVVQVQQFLTDASVTKDVTGYDDAAEWAQEFEQAFAKIAEVNPEDDANLQSIKAKFDSYYELGQTMAHAYIEQGAEQGNQIMESFDQIAKSLNDEINKYRDRALSNLENSVGQLEQSIQFIQRLMVILAIVSFALSIAIAWFVSKSITKPLTNLLLRAQEMAKGDLSTEIHQISRDETGELTQAVEAMRKQLREMLAHIRYTSEHLASSSEELAAGAEHATIATHQVASRMQELSEGSHAQVQDTERNASAMEQMAVGIQVLSNTARTMHDAAKGAAAEAEEGSHAMRKVIEQMDAMSDSVQVTVQAVNQLGERSREIEQFVNVITAISEQTHLLALNAAIEAARAGENGRGFAVVADEVRKLAEQSKQSADLIIGVVQMILGETDIAVQSMDRVEQDVASGLTVTKSAQTAFEKILLAARLVAEQVQAVSATSQRLSDGTKQISASVEEISEIAKSSAAQSEQVAALSEEQLATMEEMKASTDGLTRIAEELNGHAQKFTV